jgi:hippurate hydrolase
VDIKVTGKGGHGAMPHLTVDPVNAICHIQLALQTILSREIPAVEEVILSITMIHAGTQNNLVPGAGAMEGTLRTYNPKWKDFVAERIVQIAEKAADTFRCTAEAKVISGAPSTRVDGEVAETTREILTSQFGSEIVRLPDDFGTPKLTGSEDFSFVCDKIPGVVMMLSMGSSEEGHTDPLHHPKCRFDESVMWQGAAVYALTAMHWLQKHK